MVSLAQSYKYEVKQLSEGYYQATLSDQLHFKERQTILFNIHCKQGHTAVLGFYLFDLESLDHLAKFHKEKNDTYTVQIHLSNGEIITRQAEWKLFWIHMAEYTPQSVGGGAHAQLGGAMTLLRKYNITKIVIQGYDFPTPNFQSAATFDAMCRDLIKKIGDNGQFGTAPDNSPSGRNENVNKSVSTQTTTTTNKTTVKPTKTKPAVEISYPMYQRPNPDSYSIVTNRTMTASQMVRHPFGVLPDTPAYYSDDDIKYFLDKYPWNPKYGDPATEKNICGIWIYDCQMSYRNRKPEWMEGDIEKGRLYRYRYWFSFKSKENKPKYYDSFANQLVSELKAQGLSMSEEHTSGYLRGEGSLDNRTFRVSVTHHTELNSTSVVLDILYLTRPIVTKIPSESSPTKPVETTTQPKPATTSSATKAQPTTTTVKPSSTSTTTVKPSSTNTTAVKPSTTSTTSAAATNNSELTTVTFKQMVTQMLTNAKQYQNYRIDSVSSNPSGSFTYNFFHRSQDDAGIIILQLVADAEAMGIKLKHYKDKLGEGYYGSYNGYTIYIHSSKESKSGGLYRNVELKVKPAGAIF